MENQLTKFTFTKIDGLEQSFPNQELLLNRLKKSEIRPGLWSLTSIFSPSMGHPKQLSKFLKIYQGIFEEIRPNPIANSFSTPGALIYVLPKAEKKDRVLIPRGTYTSKEDILLYALQYIDPIFLSYYVGQKDAVITKYKRATQSYEAGEILAAINNKETFQESRKMPAIESMTLASNSSDCSSLSKKRKTTK